MRSDCNISVTFAEEKRFRRLNQNERCDSKRSLESRKKTNECTVQQNICTRNDGKKEEERQKNIQVMQCSSADFHIAWCDTVFTSVTIIRYAGGMVSWNIYYNNLHRRSSAKTSRNSHSLTRKIARMRAHAAKFAAKVRRRRRSRNSNAEGMNKFPQ